MFFRKKMFKKRNKHKQRKIRIIVFFAICISFIIFVDSTISQVIGPLAIKNAEELINRKVNAVVEEIISKKNITYNNFIYTTAVDGKVSNVQANSALINQLKSSIAIEADKSLDSNKNLVTVIQLGSIINSSLLSNKGPEIRINFDLYCSTNVKIASEFQAAGLNQTIHRIKLNVTTEFCLMIINDQYFDKITNDYVVAESVIIGQVPSAYGSIYGLNK